AVLGRFPRAGEARPAPDPGRGTCGTRRPAGRRRAADPPPRTPAAGHPAGRRLRCVRHDRTGAARGRRFPAVRAPGAVTGRGKTGRTRRRVPAGGPPLPGAGGGRIAGAQWPVAGPDATPRRLPAQPAAAVVRRAPRAARRVGGRTPGDPRPARCAPRALVTGRGPGRPLLSGRGCRLGGLARTLRRLACLRLVPHPDTLLVATHLEQVRCLDQVAELAVPVVAR